MDKHGNCLAAPVSGGILYSNLSTDVLGSVGSVWNIGQYYDTNPTALLSLNNLKVSKPSTSSSKESLVFLNNEGSGILLNSNGKLKYTKNNGKSYSFASMKK